MLDPAQPADGLLSKENALESGIPALSVIELEDQHEQTLLHLGPLVGTDEDVALAEFIRMSVWTAVVQHLARLTFLQHGEVSHPSPSNENAPFRFRQFMLRAFNRHPRASWWTHRAHVLLDPRNLLFCLPRANSDGDRDEKSAMRMPPNVKAFVPLTRTRHDRPAPIHRHGAMNAWSQPEMSDLLLCALVQLADYADAESIAALRIVLVELHGLQQRHLTAEEIQRIIARAAAWGSR